MLSERDGQVGEADAGCRPPVAQVYVDEQGDFFGAIERDYPQALTTMARLWKGYRLVAGQLQ